MKTLITFFSLLFLCISLSAQFGPERHIEPSTPENLASMDVDGDGDLDLLTNFRKTNKIVWFENLDSEGEFDSPKVFDHSFKDPDLINAADINGNGIDDLIVSSRISEKIFWYENLNGLAEFSQPKLIASNLPSLTSQTLLDIDNDGDADILIAYDSKIAWLENLDENGNFGTPKILVENIQGNVCLHMADIDNDGSKDLIFGSDEEEELQWISNINSAGSIEIVATNPNGFKSTFAADFDGDNDMDVVASMDGDSVFVWYENIDGVGTFGNPTYKELVVAEEAFKISAFDVDLDSDMDIIIHISSPTYVYISFYENTNGQGDFTQSSLVAQANGNHDFLVKDFNGDDFPDVVVIDDKISNSQIRLAKNKGSAAIGNQFSLSSLVYSHLIGSHGYAVDFDNDGDQDLISFDEGASWYENLNGQGLFSNRKHINFFLPDEFKGYLGDFNGDNFIDVLILKENEIAWYPHLDGQGNFAPRVPIDFDASFIFGKPTAAIGDFDNDGDLDVIASGSNRLDYYENTNGQGTFAPALAIANILETKYWQIEMADINGDGNQDIVVAASSRVGWFDYYNDGYGSYSNFKHFPNSGFGSTYIHVADIDGDNDNDVIFSNGNWTQSYGVLAWYENTDCQGDFEIGSIFNDSLSSQVRSIISSDIDLDGDLDILSSDNSSNEIWMFENLDGLGTFGQKNIISTQPDDISKIGMADFNGDNVDDLFSFSSEKNKIAWFKNLGTSPRLEVLTFWDENENMTKENDEIGLDLQNIEILPNGINSFSLNQGKVQFPLREGSYEINCSPSDGWKLTTPSTLNIDFQINQTSTQFFGLKQQGEIFDAEISINSSPTRCGVTVPFWLNYTNKSNQVLNAEITLVLDDLVTLVSSDRIPSHQNENQLSWFIENLNPTESGQIMIELTMPEASYQGRYLNFSSNISLVDNFGVIVYNNDTQYEPQINCNYDSNDKVVTPFVEYEGENYSLIDRNLEYTIRFQNTGIDTAFYLHVTDQLDQNLDWSTFRPLSSSHPFNVSINESGLVDFRFENILLPDWSTNPIGSQGFVKYTIKPKSDLLENTIIENKASIIFESELEFITNTTKNILVSEYPFKTEDGNQNLTFSVNPNPSIGTVNIAFELLEKQDWEIQVVNNLGKLIKTSKGNTSGIKNMTLFLSDLPTGIYYLTLFANETSKTEKLIIRN